MQSCPHPNNYISSITGTSDVGARVTASVPVIKMFSYSARPCSTLTTLDVTTPVKNHALVA